MTEGYTLETTFRVFLHPIEDLSRGKILTLLNTCELTIFNLLILKQVSGN